HHVDHQFADVTNPRQLVKLHVGIQHTARGIVHDLLLEQCIRDAHDQRAVALALRSLDVDDEPAVLCAHHLVDLHDSCLGVHRDIRHFHSAYTTGAQRAGTGVLASHLNRFHTQLGAGLLPGKALRRVGLRLNLSTCGYELVSGNPQAGGHGSEELIEGVHAPAPSGSTHSAHCSAAAGSAVDRILAISDIYRNRLERKTQGLCRHDVDYGPRPGAQVLTPQIYFDGAIGMNVHIAIAVVPTATPGVEADSQATLDGTGSLVAARVPILLPINQLSSLAEFLPVHFRELKSPHAR